ncbi:MAG TPA: hypothetical protein VF328_24120 [Mycobacterium sp.]
MSRHGPLDGSIAKCAREVGPGGTCVAAIAAVLDRPLAIVEETEAMFKLAPAGE